MTKTSFVKPIGEILQQAGLVSAEQIEEALQEQTRNGTLKLGEILARRGWLKQETANFFAEQWPQRLLQRWRQPIGRDLRAAALLDSQQVQLLLEEQNQTGTRFGELAVEKGWLTQDTIDFFLTSLRLRSDIEEQEIETQIDDQPMRLQAIQDQLRRNQHCDPYQLLLTYQKTLWHKVLRNPESQEQIELLKLGLILEQDHQFVIANPDFQAIFNTSWVDQELGDLRPFEKVRINLFKLTERASLPFVALEEVFFWTGREPFLTQAICQTIYDSETFIPANEEKERVSQIVRTHLIEDWENKVAAQHLQEILNSLSHSNSNSVALLKRYQQVIRQEALATSNDPEQEALLKLGLVVQNQRKLSVANRIYAAVFNEQWVTEEMARQQQSLLDINDINPSKLVPSPYSRDPVPAQDARPRPKSASNLGRLLMGLLLLGIIGTLIAIFAHRFLNHQTVTRNFNRGNERFNQGKYEEAIAKYNAVLNVDGNYHQAWTNRGYALAGTGKHSQMLSSCRSATIIEPQAVYAWNCQGEALHNLKQFEEAIEAFEQAIQLEPSDPVFWINKSESLIALKQFESALSASQTALEQLEKIESQTIGQGNIEQELAIAWSTKGRVFRSTDRYTDARDAYEKSLDYNPNYYPAQLGKGITLKHLKQYQEANAQFKKTLNSQLTEGQQAEVWFYSGLTYCKLRQPDQAVVAYNNALNLKPNFEAAQTAKSTYCR